MRVLTVAAVLLAYSTTVTADEPPKPGDVFKDCEECPEMVVIPPGKFMMGVHPTKARRYSPPWREEEVTDTIAVGRFEILVREYYACVEDKACRAIKVPNIAMTQQFAAYYLTWYDAKTYVDWLAKKTGKPYRLLNEKEWEYAARAGTQTVYWWGDDFEPGKDICNGCLPKGEVISGTYRLGNRIVSYSTRHGHLMNPIGGENIVPPNPFGLYFMLGNANEWTSDCHLVGKPPPSKYTPTAPDADCEARIIKGGNYSSPPDFIRPGSRGGLKASNENSHGVKMSARVALTVYQP